MRLLFLRHGIRGVDITSLSQQTDCVPLIASDANLSLEGHLYSLKVGKLIRKYFGCPNFIYGDISDGRTIDTTLSLAKGAHAKRVWFHNGDRDPFFKRSATVTPESQQAAEIRLQQIDPDLQRIKQISESTLPCLDLAESTQILPDQTTRGLLPELENLLTLSVFLQLSDLCSPINKIYNILKPLRSYLISVQFPTFNSLQVAGSDLLNGILYFLQQNQLSVLIGHDTDISILSRYLGKPYKVPGYGEQYIPPNSGFIFELKNRSLKIDYIFLTLEGKWESCPYLILDLPSSLNPPSFDLVPRLTGIC